MDVRHLKAFLATVETGSVTAAAQRIHVTQPTLSATLQQLEERLGRALFERLPRGVRPTQEGLRLYPQARRLVAEWEAMAAQFDPGGDCMSLQIGIEEGLGPWAEAALQGWCRHGRALDEALLQDCIAARTAFVVAWSWWLGTPDPVRSARLKRRLEWIACKKSG